MTQSFILLLLVLRTVSSFVSDFPVLTLPHTKAVCDARTGTAIPAELPPEAVLAGDCLPELPDLLLSINQLII